MTTTVNTSQTLIIEAAAGNVAIQNSINNWVDALLGGAKDKDLTAQPSSPSEGDLYIMPSGTLTGAAWSTYSQHDLALFINGAWTKITPASGRPGLRVWVNDEDKVYVWTGTLWLDTSLNTAFNALTTGLYGNVLSRTTTAQPGSPSEGDMYIVPTSATGADWTGEDGKVAVFFGGSWNFTPAAEGMAFYIADENEYATYNGVSWDLMESQTNKDAANGYAGLDADGYLNVSSIIIQQDLASNLVLEDGELGYGTDTGAVYIGDGGTNYSVGDSSRSVITVSPTQDADANETLLITALSDAEDLLITLAKEGVNTVNGAIGSGTVSLVVDDVSKFYLGDLITFGNNGSGSGAFDDTTFNGEWARVTSINTGTNTLTITRGYKGAATAITDNWDIYRVAERVTVKVLPGRFRMDTGVSLLVNHIDLVSHYGSESVVLYNNGTLTNSMMSMPIALGDVRIRGLTYQVGSTGISAVFWQINVGGISEVSDIRERVPSTSIVLSTGDIDVGGEALLQDIYLPETGVIFQIDGDCILKNVISNITKGAVGKHNVVGAASPNIMDSSFGHYSSNAFEVGANVAWRLSNVTMYGSSGPVLCSGDPNGSWFMDNVRMNASPSQFSLGACTTQGFNGYEEFKRYGSATLDGAVTSGATSFSVLSAANLSVGDIIQVGDTSTGAGAGSGAYDDDAWYEELMRITGISGTTVTVSRAYQGTGRAMADTEDVYVCRPGLHGARVMIDSNVRAL